MNFGEIPTAQAKGCILAHSLRVDNQRFAKGQLLDGAAIAQLLALNVTSVTVARLSPLDVDENAAAARLAVICATDQIEITTAFSGRVNLLAKRAGVLRVDAAQVARLNSVHEAITFACLADYSRVAKGMLLGTFKIIPYGVDKKHFDAAIGILDKPLLSLHGFAPQQVDLILTQTPNFKTSLLDKGKLVIDARISPLNMTLATTQIVPHRIDSVTTALENTTQKTVLVLGASATSDRKDVIPAALTKAGGSITRFGMPVDPGNLLLLGNRHGQIVIGLPGCARAPALNGTDWVLERLAAGLSVNTADIAAMGVGGLLKEIPQRQLPRRARGPVSKGKVELVLLAAGKSSRMRGQNKMLREISGQPMLRHAARVALASKVARVHVVLPPDAPECRAALQGLDLDIVPAQDAHLGLSDSVRAGIGAVSSDCAAVVMMLADMPDVNAGHINALIDGYSPENEHFIVVPVAPNGKRGNPALFDRRYFETLANLQGDRGAKSIIDQAGAAVATVTTDAAVLLDLDTPEAWAKWDAENNSSKKAKEI